MEILILSLRGAEAYTGEEDCPVGVVPGKGDYGGRGIEGIRGSWLVFEVWR